MIIYIKVDIIYYQFDVSDEVEMLVFEESECETNRRFFLEFSQC